MKDEISINMEELNYKYDILQNNTLIASCELFETVMILLYELNKNICAKFMIANTNIMDIYVLIMT